MTTESPTAASGQPEAAPRISDEERRRSLRYSMVEGVYASIMVGMTASFMIPFALALKAVDFYIGLLTALPMLLSALVQLCSAEYERLGGRLKGIVWSVYAQMLTCFLIMVLALTMDGLPALMMFIVLVILHNVTGSVSFPLWASLMGDTVRSDQYGRYFARRNFILGSVTIAASFAGAFLLDRCWPGTMRGFALLFGVAGLARIFSGLFVAKMVDVPLAAAAADAGPFGARFSYWEFIRRLPESNFVKFVVFNGLLNFAIFVAGPFFAVLMLKEYHLSYTEFVLVMNASAVASLASFPFWGRYTDRIGNVKVMRITAYIIPLLPFGFVITDSVWFLVAVNAVCGYVWTGFNLAANNFIYDAVTPSKRTRCIAYFSATNGAALFLGIMFGSSILGYLPKLPGFFSSQIVTLIYLSALARLIVVLGFARSFREVRDAEAMDDSELILTILGIRPGLDMINGFAAALRPRGK